MKRFIYFFVFLPLLLNAQDSEQKYSLFYENDAHELTVEHHEVLGTLNALNHKDSLDVHIIGYTNNVGNEAYNLRLSKKRAEGVKEQLRAFTIISTKGFGELDGEEANNRRVDILVHLKRDHITVAGEIVEAPIIEQKEPEPTLISLAVPQVGDKIILKGIFFYEDRDVIMDESKEALDALVSYLTKNPKVKFKLIGHICCGDPMKPYKDHKNVRTGKDNLSEARAQALHNYLSKKGVHTRRMRYLGMAFLQSTGKGDQFDRRVEIEITSVD